MKKIQYFAILLVSIALGLSACKKTVVEAVSENCEEEVNAYVAALQVWSADFSNKAKCEDVKAKLNKVVKDCSVLTPGQRTQYENELKNMTCN